MAVVMMGLSSCLNDSDSSESTVYQETAITDFSISAINRYIHTTSASGEDSVYKAKLSTTNFPFSIDQYQRKIYNADSLPSDCDLKHVLVNITTSTYSGTVIIKDLDSDTLQYYSSTDSIDFSQPREIRVYNSSLETYRAYKVQLNINTDASEYFHWDPMPKDSPDMPANIDRTVSITTGNDGAFQLSLDGGATWSNEQLGEDEDPAYLPSAAASYLSFVPKGYIGTRYHLLVGRMEPADFMCTVMRRIEADNSGKWVCLLNLPITDSYPGYLPVSDHISLVCHNGAVLAVLDNGDIYESRDYGLSWQKKEEYNMPDGAGTAHLRAANDEAGYVWLKNIETGEVWRGYFVTD